MNSPVPITKLPKKIAEEIQRIQGDKKILPAQITVTYPENARPLRNWIQNTLLDHEKSIPGIAFQTYQSLARDIVQNEGYRVRDAEPFQRLVAVKAYVRSLPDAQNQTELRYYDPEQLKTGPGYAEAFASTIRECEKANRFPDDLLDIADSTPEVERTRRISDRIQDLVTIWKHADSRLGWPIAGNQEDIQEPVSPGNILHTAVQLLEKTPDVIPENIIAVRDRPYPVEDQLMNALNSSENSNGILELERRTEKTPNPETNEPSMKSPSQRVGKEDPLRSLKRHLFDFHAYESRLRSREDKEKMTKTSSETSSDKPTSPVRMERYNTFETEIEHTCQWVFQKVNEGIPPGRIGVITMDSEGIGSIHAFLRSLEQQGDLKQIPVSLQGLSPKSFSSGAAILSLFRALRNFLNQDEMVDLLPRISRELRWDTELEEQKDERSVCMSPSEWRKLIFESGMLGGSRARQEDAKNWIDNLEQKIEALKQNQQEIEEMSEEEREENPRYQQNPEHLKRKQNVLENHLEPVKKLVELSEDIAADELDVKQLTDALLTFIERYMPISEREQTLYTRLEEAYENYLPEGPSGDICGLDALQILQDLFLDCNVTPADVDPDGVFVGSLENAAFRSFDALRIIHMTENSLPEIPREDPVFSDAVRKQLNDNSERVFRTSEEKAKEQLETVHRLIQSTKEELVFSTVQKDRSGQKKAPASLFVDIGLASGIARSNPDEHELERLMKLGRKQVMQNTVPIRSNNQTKTNSNRQNIQVPSSWKQPESSIRQLERIRDWMKNKDHTEVLGAPDGLLKGDIPDAVFPGLTPERKLSASSAKRFLKCPHRFLLNKLLGYEEPPEAPPATRLSAMHFGSLFHATAERLYRELDASELAQDDGVESIVDEEFDRYMEEEYALKHSQIKENERNRLKDAIQSLIDMDQKKNRLNREFLTEQRYEATHPLPDNESISLFGYLDRIDLEPTDQAAIRDLKTGSAKTDEKFLHKHDIQLGVYYWLAHEASSGEFGEVNEVSFLYPAGDMSDDRTFRRNHGNAQFDLDALTNQVDQWLEVIEQMQSQRAFVRTHDDDDCRYCPYQDICGENAQSISEEKITAADPSWKDHFLKRHD